MRYGYFPIPLSLGDDLPALRSFMTQVAKDAGYDVDDNAEVKCVPATDPQLKGAAIGEIVVYGS